LAGTIEHIHARNAALYVQDSAITYGAAVSVDQSTGSASIFKVKNMVLTPPMGEVERIDLWGEDKLDTIGSNVPSTGTWQITAMDEKSWTFARVTFTLVFSSDEVGSTAPDGNSLEVLFHGAGIDIADTPAFTRYTYGDTVTSARKLVGNMIFVWNNGTQIANAAMSRPVVTKLGEIRVTGQDGHWEQDCEAVCFAQDFIRENED